MRNPKQMKFDPGVDTGKGSTSKVELDFVRDFIEDKNILNIGCWTGKFEYNAAALAKNMVSIDIEPKALEVARENIPTVNFIQASIFDVPFPNESFDLVTLWSVIEHIPVDTEPRAFAEIARVLRRGGYLALSTPNSHILSKIFDPAYILAGHRHYSPVQLSAMLEEAGFSVTRIEQLGGWYSILSILVFYTWKYLVHRQPDWGWLAKASSKDEKSPGFNMLYILAGRG